MLIHIHQTIGYVTRSVLQAQLVAEVEAERFPDDPQDFADRHGGDYLEIAPGENDE